MEQDMSEMTFGQMKTALASTLDRAACQGLCTYFNINEARTDKIMNAPYPELRVLRELTEKDDIKEDDVTKLQAALRVLKLVKAANIVSDYQEQFGKLTRAG